jgi:hypothetical protein
MGAIEVDRNRGYGLEWGRLSAALRVRKVLNGSSVCLFPEYSLCGPLETPFCQVLLGR